MVGSDGDGKLLKCQRGYPQARCPCWIHRAQSWGQISTLFTSFLLSSVQVSVKKLHTMANYIITGNSVPDKWRDVSYLFSLFYRESRFLWRLEDKQCPELTAGPSLQTKGSGKLKAKRCVQSGTEDLSSLITLMYTPIHLMLFRGTQGHGWLFLHASSKESHI